MAGESFPFKVKMRLAAVRVVKRLSFLIPDRHLLVRSNGSKIYLNLREYPSMIYRAFGVYEYWQMQVVKKLVDRPATVIDVGACKGDYSLLLAKSMGDSGTVLTFEPDPDNSHWISKSIRANGYKCIRLNRLAISDAAGEMPFYVGKKSGWGSLIFHEETSRSQSEVITVPVRTLDSALEAEGVAAVDFMKIDVEGAEQQVVNGARDTLINSPELAILMDLHLDEQEDRQQLTSSLESLGFKLFSIGPPLSPILSPGELVGKTLLALKGTENLARLSELMNPCV